MTAPYETDMPGDRTFGAAVTPDELACFDALALVYTVNGRATVRDVAKAAGIGVGTAHKHLWALRRLRMADWTFGQAGTLRPIVRVVATLEEIDD